MTIFRRSILSVFLILLSATSAFCQQATPYILHATNFFQLIRIIVQYGLIFDHPLLLPHGLVVVDIPNPTATFIAQVSADPSVVFFEQDQAAQTPEPTTTGQIDP